MFSYIVVKLFREFMGHLKGPEMGKDDKAALQHVKQVWAIWKDVANNTGIFQLSDRLNEDNIRDAWLAPFVKVWKPGTAKSYLGSLSLFLDFLTTRKVVDQTTLSSVLAAIKRLQRSLRKRALQARTAQETEDLGKMFSLVYEKCILDICT